MKNEYLNIYNNLIKLTRNKLLFEKITKEDSFSQRLMIFLFHFAFFLKIYKKDNTKKYLQKIYDFNFKQLELSVREIGYGDSIINKKMKQYVNIFYSIIDKVENWEKVNNAEKCKIFSEFIEVHKEAVFFVNYFEKYRLFLLNNALNHFRKDVISFKF
jgi:cytochrome b pre-mRNA-processing protein 3